MINSKKRKSMRQRLAMVMSVALTLTSLYTGQVSAAELPAEEGIATATSVSGNTGGSADQGGASEATWVESITKPGYLEKTTTYDFTGTDTTLPAGITNIQGNVAKKSGYLSMSKTDKTAAGITGVVTLDLDAATSEIDFSFALTSNNSARSIVIGEGSQETVSLDTSKSPAIDADKKYAQSYDSTYFPNHKLRLEGITSSDTDSAEIKFGSITLVEYKLNEQVTIPAGWTESTTKPGWWEKITEYDFTGTDTTLPAGITNIQGNVAKKSGYLSMSKTDKTAAGITGVVTLDLDAATSEINFSFALTSNNSARSIVIGEGSQETVSLDTSKSPAIDADKKYAQSYDSTYFPNHKLRLEGITSSDTDSAEIKFGSITLVEYQLAKGDVEIPENVQITPSITGDLKGNDLYLVNGENSIKVTNGEVLTLPSQTNYDLVIKDAEDKVVSGMKATANGSEKFNSGIQDAPLAIKVETTVLTLTPTITPVDEASALGDNAVWAVSSKEEKKLENGTEIVLPKDTEYTLEVRDASEKVLPNWKATVKVDGEDVNKFKTTTEETQAIEVFVKNIQEVAVTITVKDNGSLLGTNAIYLVNGADSVKVESGKELTLKPNTEYQIVIKDADGAEVTNFEASTAGKTTYKTGTETAAVELVVSTKSTRTVTYDFRDNSGKTKPKDVGAVLDGTNTVTSGILYMSAGSSSGCSFDSNQLRFRNGVELWIPIQDDTTKVTYAYTGNGNNAGRPTYLGSKDSGVELPYDKVERSATLDDITDYIKVGTDGQKYFPIYSGGDVKILEIKLTEYNPVNSVTVTGKISNAAENGIKEVIFKNMDNEKAEIVHAPIEADGTYSVVLRRVGGNTKYAASVSATGFKIEEANDADKFTLLGNGATATQDFTVVDSPIATVSGTVTGIPDSALKGTLGVELIPDNPAISNIPLNLTKTGDGTYSFADLVLDIDRPYTVALTNADDYEVKAVIEQGADAPNTIEIKATTKPVVSVTGNFITSDDKVASVSKITFTNMDKPEYSYSFDVTGGSYTAELREAEYETSVECVDYEAFDHVTVKSEAVANDVYLQGAVDTSAVPYQATVEVGEGKQFEKIADAVDYISRMERTATQRVTIVLDAGKVYREQLVIDTPNITIQGNGATITWYYGVGFSYYSAKLSADGKSAYYDEAHAVDKYEKVTISQNPGHWGAAVNLLADAAGFAAEDVVFENSLSRYLTTEEIADGADENVAPAVTARNKEGIDVRSMAAKERACAIYIQADNTEYKNCQFLSSQDTVYTGDSVENSYFVNCKLEGTTDYICGDGNPVFDKCVLSMYSYTDKDATESYIVASKEKGAHGYLFNDCKIVTTSDAGLKPTSKNILARAWGAGTVTWLNTEVESATMIDSIGYKKMNVDVTAAHYYEYNTHTPDGTPVDTAGRAEGVTIMTAEQAADVDMISYFDGWAPQYYEGELCIEIGEMNLDIDAPAWSAERNNDVACETHGVVVGDLKWYVGDKEFTGATFEPATIYTAVVPLSIEGRYKFLSNMKVTAKGGTAVAEVNADGTEATITITYAKTSEEGYYVLKLENGLKKGVNYNGGISVVEDMPYKSVTSEESEGDEIGGVTYPGYVAGTSNPKADGANCSGNVPDSGSALKLVAEQDGKLKLGIKINAGKTIYFVDGTTGKCVEEYKNGSASSEFKMVSYEVEAGHSYYFYGNGTKVPMYFIAADYRTPEAWDNIAAPVLGTPVVDAEKGSISVPFSAQVGGIYADELEVRMLLNGEIVDTISYTRESTEGEVEFLPQASGTYTFQAILRRSGMLGKNSNTTTGTVFALPMRKPVIINIENQGEGNVKLSWKEVVEAESYNVYLDGALKDTVAVPYYRFKGLTPGREYEFGVAAVRGEDVSEIATQKQTVTQEAKKTWNFAAFGSGVDEDYNDYSGSVDTKDLALWSTGGKGKIVPASTDGLAFYYTTIDPETENFTLSADVTVDNWTYSNGQEGFGLMAADAIGEHGDASVFWNNSYMASVTKVEYYWDKSAGKVSDSGDKYTMKLGVGSQEKIGVTTENIADGSVVNDFKTTLKTLDTYCPENGMPAGTYNMVDKYTNDTDLGDVNLQTTFHLTIQRNNTGYFLSYTNAVGETVTQKYYHGDDGDELTKLDANNIYVGFFASRYAKVNVSNVVLDTINPEEDAPAEERPITYVTPNYTIESASIANTENYEIVYYGNADGTLTITNADGAAVASNKPVVAKEKYRFEAALKKGDNTFNVVFTPNADYKPSKYELLSSYDTKKFDFTVKYVTSTLQNIYISPEGKADATGSKENPMDIYSAVKIVAPGQKLLLMEGTYNLNRTVTIERGIDGTENKKIYMIADPEAATRPVLDFQDSCAGMVMAGDYWYFQGFDVTNSANGQKGIQVSGSYNILDDLCAYENGNTGIQISRFKGTDEWEDWPSNNLILNCTSYLNADAGYEDADGFAAKLTIADGNVFDGCIAAYNADDGWDLFAKVESGPIGKVVIRNSVTFKNGYVLDENNEEVNAGNGNGFKLGGSSISGYHTLENSIAFGNKAKGIDSNSCPDIQVYNSTSYNNESYNVAFYTNDTSNTDFLAKGVLSFKDSNDVEDELDAKGSQDESKIWGVSNYYFNGKKAVNTEGAIVDATWFVSTDMEKAIDGGITRNADGTINMNGFLELAAVAPADTGARLSGSSSVIIPVTPDKPNDLITMIKAEPTATIPESVLTDAVKKATGCDTVEELTSYLVKEMVGNADADKVLTGVKQEDISIVDIVVKVSFDGGYTWEVATEENFPKTGLDLILPYPQGTSADGQDFVIAHLVTLACNGAVPGTTEYFEPEKTENGLKIHIKSASPFVIGWVDVEDDDDDDSEDTDSGSSTDTVNNQSQGENDGRKSPGTLDVTEFVPLQSEEIAVTLPDTTPGENEQPTVNPVVVAAPGMVQFSWFLILAVAALGCAAAVIGIQAYRSSKKEDME